MGLAFQTPPFSAAIAYNWSATQTITMASGTSPDWEVAITGDTNSRVAIGMNSTDVARLSMGPGNAVRDTFLERAGAANWRFGAPDAAAPVAQTLSMQNVITGTSNTVGAAFTINGSRGTGTGAGGSIILQTAAAGSTGSTPNALATALTVDSAGVTSFGPVASTQFINPAMVGGSSAMRIGVGGANVLGIFNTHTIVRSDGGYSWNNAANLTAFSQDLFLLRDAANTLAQRNGANAQSFRVYNTTDLTNLERGALDWQTTANWFRIGTSAAGTGSSRNMYLDPAGGIIGISGATSSFPALKRSSTVLQARLADDSTFAPLQGALRTAANATTGLGAGILAALTNASIVVTDASGQDYRIPCII